VTAHDDESSHRRYCCCLSCACSPAFSSSPFTTGLSPTGAASPTRTSRCNKRSTPVRRWQRRSQQQQQQYSTARRGSRGVNFVRRCYLLMKVDRDKNWKRRPFSGVPAARKSKGPINMAMVEGGGHHPKPSLATVVLENY
jgi:hypothetical protein